MNELPTVLQDRLAGLSSMPVRVRKPPGKEGSVQRLSCSRTRISGTRERPSTVCFGQLLAPGQLQKRGVDIHRNDRFG